MKRACFIAIVLLILLSISTGVTGCGMRGVEENGYYRFKIVETYKDGQEIVDKDTGYGYFQFSGGGGIVPLYDEYGNPYKENGWRDKG